MNDKDEFLKQMENLQLPVIDPQQHPEKTKIAIMNSERSAALGVWLIIVPCYFLLCVCMYYCFHQRVNTSWFASMYTLITGLNKTPYIDFLAPIILFVLPIVCIVINALAITHVGYQRLGENHGRVKEFTVTVKIKLYNILLIILSLVIIGIFMSYVLAENISFNN